MQEEAQELLSESREGLALTAKVAMLESMVLNMCAQFIRLREGNSDFLTEKTSVSIRYEPEEAEELSDLIRALGHEFMDRAQEKAEQDI